MMTPQILEEIYRNAENIVHCVSLLDMFDWDAVAAEAAFISVRDALCGPMGRVIR